MYENIFDFLYQYSSAAVSDFDDVKNMTDEELEKAFQSVDQWFEDMVDELLLRACCKDADFEEWLLDAANDSYFEDWEGAYDKAAKILGIDLYGFV